MSQWVENGIEQLLLGSDVEAGYTPGTIRPQSVLQSDFVSRVGDLAMVKAEVIDGGIDQIGRFILSARIGSFSECRSAAASLVSDKELRKVARELLEPYEAAAESFAKECGQ